MVAVGSLLPPQTQGVWSIKLRSCWLCSIGVLFRQCSDLSVQVGASHLALTVLWAHPKSV